MRIKKILLSLISIAVLSTSVPVSATEQTPTKATENVVQDIPVFAQSGTGDAVLTFSLPAGAYKAHFIHDGKRNFVVKCHKGDDWELLANTIGAYDGYTTLFDGEVEAYTDSLLEIKADGNWIIVIEQIIAPSTSNIFGVGDQVTGIIQGNGTNNVVNIINANASRNFVVRAYALDGSDWELLANEIGNYSGQEVFKMKNVPYYLEIQSDGAWVIDFGRGEELTTVGAVTTKEAK